MKCHTDTTDITDIARRWRVGCRRQNPCNLCNL